MQLLYIMQPRKIPLSIAGDTHDVNILQEVKSEAASVLAEPLDFRFELFLRHPGKPYIKEAHGSR